MPKTIPVCKSDEALTVAEIQDLAQAWIDDGEVRQLSDRTLEERRDVTGKLLWFLKDREHRSCGTREIRAFLAYVNRGHEDPRGRWGNPKQTRPVSPATLKAYHRVIRAFCNWLLEAGEIEVSPIDSLRAPIVRADQIKPFTRDQMGSLLEAAHKSLNPRRNEALVLFMADTGIRATEVCSLRRSALDLTGKSVRILGKGRKIRTVPIGRQATRALWAYLREEEREQAEDGYVFLSERGVTVGDPLTRQGLYHVLRDLGAEAKLQGVRCSPHTFRHYFAVEFLRAGGNVFTLKELLGHTTLAMTNKYVAFVQADLEAQHRQFSPGDRIKRK